MTMICIVLSQDSLPPIVTLRDDTAGRDIAGVPAETERGRTPAGLVYLLVYLQGLTLALVTARLSSSFFSL